MPAGLACAVARFRLQPVRHHHRTRQLKKQKLNAGPMTLVAAITRALVGDEQRPALRTPDEELVGDPVQQREPAAHVDGLLRPTPSPSCAIGQMVSRPLTVKAAWQSTRGFAWHCRNCSSSSGWIRSSRMSSINTSQVARPEAASCGTKVEKLNRTTAAKS